MLENMTAIIFQVYIFLSMFKEMQLISDEFVLFSKFMLKSIKRILHMQQIVQLQKSHSNQILFNYTIIKN